MKNYKVEDVSVDALVMYDRNAKKHTDDQIDKIANSIREFGFRQNLVIDRNNVVIIGHGRLLAARKMGLQAVPCMRVEDLSDAQIKALRLADNRVAESDWDEDLLRIELDDLPGIDMSDFGFDLSVDEDEPATDDDDDDDDEEDVRDSLTHNVFENQERMQFDADNFYGIPSMQPTQTYGDKLLRFCDYGGVKDHSEYICHFYYDDFKFISAWRDPDKYISKLRKFKAVISPDFSLYTDFPRALQILSCYRRQWCGAYWQSLGLDVIPDVVQDKAFMSTASAGSGFGGLTYHILTPPGKGIGAYVRPISKYKGEKEFLFNHGSAFVIKGAYKDEYGSLHCNLEYIGRS